MFVCSQIVRILHLTFQVLEQLRRVQRQMWLVFRIGNMLSLNSCDFEQHENTNCYELVVEGKYPVESKLVTSLDQSPSKFDIWAMACCPVIKVMRKSNKCQTKITQEQPTSRQRDNPKLCQSLTICCKRQNSHKKIQDDEAKPRLPSSLFCSCRSLKRPSSISEFWRVFHFSGIQGLNVETTPAREVCTSFECPNDNEEGGLFQVAFYLGF